MTLKNWDAILANQTALPLKLFLILLKYIVNIENIINIIKIHCRCLIYNQVAQLPSSVEKCTLFCTNSRRRPRVQKSCPIGLTLVVHEKLLQFNSFYSKAYLISVSISICLDQYLFLEVLLHPGPGLDTCLEVQDY